MTATAALPVAMVDPPSKQVRFTNCRLARGTHLTAADLTFSPTTGRILDAQSAFFAAQPTMTCVHDLGGKIVCPGFIEVQLNGAYGMDFSVPTSAAQYGRDLARVNRRLVATGVTSYLPTLTSQRPGVYQQVLPLLAPRGTRDAGAGAEPLGTHCEGPFLSAGKPGIHAPAVLQTPTSFADLEACYGAANVAAGAGVVRKVTLAPELNPAGDVVPELVRRGIVASVGHTMATAAEALRAVAAGATMVTHMYNAMPQPHHRDEGVFGLLGAAPAASSPATDGRPFFGLIADGVHVAPRMARIAYRAHPTGCIVVTDSLHVLGLPDGVYPWPNGGKIRKAGARVTSLDGKTLAGACATMVECVNNIIEWAEDWSGDGIARGLRTATETPARMLGLTGKKGGLEKGGDADLLVLEEVTVGARRMLRVDEVWKFGVRVYSRDEGRLADSEGSSAKL